jgi:hypothetical protein
MEVIVPVQMACALFGRKETAQFSKIGSLEETELHYFVIA